MGLLKSLAHRLRALFLRRATERDLDDEIRFHLELEAEKNARAGMAPGEARRRARITFGSVESVKEAHRDGRGIRWLKQFVSDVRYGLRVLRRSPALAGAAVSTIALGISANVAIFSAVNAVILRPLPFHRPGRLVMLWEENPEFRWYQAGAAPANVLDWREQVPGFDDVAGYADFESTRTLTGEGAPQLLTTVGVTGNFFSVLGVEASKGRMLLDDETWKTATAVAVISDRLWRDEFGADPAIAGRTIVLDGEAVQVVGVAAPSFRYPSAEIDAWVPFGWDPAVRSRASFRRAHWLRAIARLAPGVSACDRRRATAGSCQTPAERVSGH